MPSTVLGKARPTGATEGVHVASGAFDLEALDQVLALQPVELRRIDQEERRVECAVGLAAAGAVAVEEDVGRSVDLECDPAAKAAAANHVVVGLGGARALDHAAGHPGWVLVEGGQVVGDVVPRSFRRREDMGRHRNARIVVRASGGHDEGPPFLRLPWDGRAAAGAERAGYFV